MTKQTARTRKSLTLSKDSVRKLTRDELKVVAGGTTADACGGSYITCSGQTGC